MPQRNLLIVIFTTALSYACYVRGEQNPYARYVAVGLDAIDEGALEPVRDRELFHGAMKGMVGVLNRHGDEHSEFLAEEEADPLRTEIRQQFGGIGVRIGFEGEPPRLTIVAPPASGTPAAQANLLPGDRILSIDGQATDGLEMTDVLRLMRGVPGTKIELTIQHKHETQPRTVLLLRAVIDIESILGDRRARDGSWLFRLAADPRIAHIRIASFGDRTAAEFERILEDVIVRGVQAVVLDVRDNPGGALQAAVAICKILLPAGKTIVETRGRGHALRERYETTEDGRFLRLPLAVIVNHNSASAAEIVAACLQDHRRAIIVGERSYGKGTVQQLVPLESGRSLLKLTWASFWRPSGAKIHRTLQRAEQDTWGVMPDAGFERKLTPEEYAAYRKYRSDRDLSHPNSPDDAAAADQAHDKSDFVDEQLRIAVEQLQGKLAK